MENPTAEEGKTIAIISYITLIGLIIAFIMNNDKKNAFASFHIRQSTGIILLAIVINVIFYIVYVPILPLILSIGLLVLWILGLISAVQGEMKPVPVLGVQFQQWFKGM